MSFSISIPELNDRDLSIKDFYHSLVVLLDHEVFHLRQKYTSESICDLRAYPLQICSRIIKQAFTIGYVIEGCEDYVSANALIRNLADSIASFILIYKDSLLDIKVLRHYLYIMDGLSQRIKRLPDKPVYDGKITEVEFQMLKDQIVNAKSNYLAVYRTCELNIKQLSIYSEHQSQIEKYIQKKTWRFKDITSSDTYSWNSLYDFLELNSSSYFSFLSEYVHGLSTSNLVIENQNDTYQPLYGVTICLLGKLKEALQVIYEDDIDCIKQKMVSILCDPRFPSAMFNDLLSEVDKRSM